MNTTTGQIAGGFQRVGRIMEEQAQMTFDGALEGLKAHRNLLASCHVGSLVLEWFIRYLDRKLIGFVTSRRICLPDGIELFRKSRLTRF